MSSFKRVLPSGELPASRFGPAAVREVQVEGTALLLARRPGGDVVAFAPFCPHQGTPLKHASFWEEGYLQCPQHRYVYDPLNGENIIPTRQAHPEFIWRLKPGYLRTHPVEEREGWIWVSVSPNPPPTEYGPDNPPPPLLVRRTLGASSTRTERVGPVEHPEESIAARAGETIELIIPTRALPGHMWRIESSEDLVALAGQAFEPGEQPTYRLRFAARAPGVTRVRCVYARPWGGVASEVRTYHIVVEDRA